MQVRILPASKHNQHTKEQLHKPSMAKKQTAQPGNMISFNPETFTSGGLFDDEDAVVKEAVFEVWDYDGKAGNKETTALRLVMATPDGTEHTQYWSVGDPNVYWPSDDGGWIISTKAALNSSSNFAIFLSMLIQGAGFPLDRIEGNISGLVGLDAHWQRVPPPKKRTVKKSTDDSGNKREDLVLVVSVINALPGEGKGKGKGTANRKAAAAKATTTELAAGGSGTAAGDADQEMEDGCVAAVNIALLEAGGTMAKKDVAKKSMPHLPEAWDQPRKNHAVIKVIYTDEWLGAHPADWTYDNGVITAVA
jgi:hypothetical protein